jgi:hypothetical protein
MFPFNRFFPRWYVSVLALVLSFGWVYGQSSRDTVLEVTASTSGAVPHVTLSWPAPGNASTSVGTKVWRRVKGASSWGTATTLPVGATVYADMTAEPGVWYEYSLQAARTVAPTVVYGVIASGYDIALRESRGHVIVLVDDTMSVPLGAELERLEADLVADGWQVHRRDVPREQVPVEATGDANEDARLAERVAVRRVVQDLYATAPGEEWSLLIFGRVPVVYSGLLGPDGHGSRAWPTDTYYADMDGTWTDSIINSTSWSEPAYQNVRGDGKLDPSTLPSDVELCTGRVDLARLDGVPVGVSETEKLRRYLERDHQFRRGLAPYDNVARRLVVDDNFGYFSGEAFASSGWRAGIALFGRASVGTGDWFTTLANQPVLLAYGCGGGSYSSVTGVGTAVDFGTRDSQAVFTMFFGSYFGSWDSANNVLRAPLAGTADSLGLASMWSGRGYFHLAHLALGETIGYANRFTQNNSASSFTGGWPQNNYFRSITYNLMGDPTLRLHSVRAPSHLVATSEGAGVTLSWTASADAALGYHVYRGDSPEGPFTRLTGVNADASHPDGSPVTGTTWTDTSAAAGQTYTWLVKAVRRETSASGTYINQSLGEAVTHTYVLSGPTLPSTPVGLAVSATGASTRRLAWADVNAGTATTTVQRYDVFGGTWQTIASVAAGTAAYDDDNAPVGVAATYRVRADNATGASAWSDSASANINAGLAAFAATETTVDRSQAFSSPVVRRLEGSTGAVSAGVSVASLFNPLLPNGDLESWTGSVPSDAVVSGTPVAPAPGLSGDSSVSAWLPVGSHLVWDARKQPQLGALSFTLAATDPGSATSRSFHLVLSSRNPPTQLTSLIILRMVRGSTAGQLTLQAYDGAAWQSVVPDIVAASVYNPADGVFTALHPLRISLAIDLANATYDLRYGEPGGPTKTQTLTYFQNQPDEVNGDRLARIEFASNLSASGYAVDDISLFSHDDTVSDFQPVTTRLNWAHADATDRPVALDLPAPATSPSLSEIISLSLAEPDNGLKVGYPNPTYLFLCDPAAQAMPAPWTSQTFGPSVVDPGYAEYANGAFGIKVRTSDLTGVQDSLRTISRPVTGDFQFTARLHLDAALTPNARHGLMVRASNAANAAMEAIMVKPLLGSAAIAMVRYRRAATGSSLGVSAVQYAVYPHPLWLRVIRSGTSIRSFYSRDGEVFTEFGTTSTLGLTGSTLQVGMAAASATPPSSGIDLSTYARFDHVTLYTPVSALAGLSSASGSGSVTLTWSANAAATAYRVERRGPTDSDFVPAGETTEATWTDAGLDPASTYTYRVYAFNPAYESSPSEVSAQPGPLSGYDLWVTSYAFGQGVDAIPLADPDRDNLANLLEYALGRDPLIPDSQDALRLDRSADGEYLTLTFDRLADPDLTYTVEGSGSLQAGWLPLWSSTGSDNLAGPVTVTDNTPLSSAAHRFLLLRVSKP